LKTGITMDTFMSGKTGSLIRTIIGVRGRHVNLIREAVH
jgi:hypothetical protein